MSEHEKNFQIVRASGIYDAVILAPFAIPMVSTWTLAKLQFFNELLALEGEVPELSATGHLFLNMMAVLAILYAILRIKRPTRLFGGYDAVARFLMASLLVVYLLFFDIAGVFWGFAIVEIVWGIAQYLSVRRR